MSKKYVSLCCDAVPKGELFQVSKVGVFGTCSQCLDQDAEFEIAKDEEFPKREQDPENQDK